MPNIKRKCIAPHLMGAEARTLVEQPNQHDEETDQVIQPMFNIIRTLKSFILAASAFPNVVYHSNNPVLKESWKA